MTTQSTPLLGLALPVTGELDGSWGDVVNNSLTSLVDSAVAGIVTVNVTSPNQALSYTPLVANEARSAILKITTTNTAAFSVYAPPNSKVYVVWNASSYPVTLYNSTVAGNTTAAGTGVLIPPGVRTLVMTDGTNCYAPIPSQAGNSIGSAATITPTINTPQYSVNSQSTAGTFAIPPAGIDGQRLVIRIKDNGTSRVLNWTTTAGGYRAIGTVLPTATVAGKVTYIGLLYNANDGYWDVVSVITET